MMYAIILSIFIISCGGGPESSSLPDITITTSSSEAKEAFLKAIGVDNKLKFKDVEVRNNLMGAPNLVVRGNSLKNLNSHMPVLSSFINKINS